MIRAFALAVVAGMLPALAAAQAPSTTPMPIAPKANQTDPQNCASGDTASTVGAGGTFDSHKPADGNLSDKLARSNGVICPPAHVDPDIHAPTPETGRMTVIPPPGSPGGDPNVQPK